MLCLAMSTATLQGPRTKVKPLPKRDLHRALRRLGISQNELARRIGKDPGLVSRVINRKLVSSIIWGRIHAFLADPERYTPPSNGAAA
jgi:predicted N-formylglutamate amidohydrolase